MFGTSGDRDFVSFSRWYQTSRILEGGACAKSFAFPAWLVDFQPAVLAFLASVEIEGAHFKKVGSRDGNEV